jgi:hypothetical protein
MHEDDKKQSTVAKTLLFTTCGKVDTRRLGHQNIAMTRAMTLACMAYALTLSVDALEVVRQLFAGGFVQSAFWHRFALSVHSEMAADPATFGMRVGAMERGLFARNEIPVLRGVDAKVVAMGPGLHKAVYNFMYGLGLDEDVRVWFDARVPRPGVSRQLVAGMVAERRGTRGTEVRD